MSSRPLFSVIIPCYNREETIAATLHSVLQQECTDFEILVVDDGSTDETARVAEQVLASSPHAYQIIPQENQGPGAARNNGVSEARGQYIAFLDSDDLWFPWTLRVYAETIRGADHPSFLGGAITYFDHETELEENESEPVATHYSDYLEAAREGVFVGSGMSVIRKRAFEEVGGFETTRMNSEDHDMALRLGTKPGFIFVEQPNLIGVRVHPGQISNSPALSSRGIQTLIEREKRGAYPGGRQRKGDRTYILSQHARSSSLKLLKENHPREALAVYLSTFSWQLHHRKLKYLLSFIPLTLAGVVGLNTDSLIGK